MTNVRDNEILTQVGPGTPMGERIGFCLGLLMGH